MKPLAKARILLRRSPYAPITTDAAEAVLKLVLRSGSEERDALGGEVREVLDACPVLSASAREYLNHAAAALRR